MKKIIIGTSLLLIAITSACAGYVGNGNSNIPKPQSPVSTKTIATLATPSSPKVGDIIYRSNFNDLTSQKTWTTNNNIRFVKSGSTTIVSTHVIPGEEKLMNLIYTQVNLAPYVGMKLQFNIRARANAVSKPSASYLGVKYMAHFTSASGPSWLNQNDVYGTFDWKDLSFSALIPEGTGTGMLFLGLQDSYGDVDFDNLTIGVLQEKPMVRDTSKFTGVSYKGHDLPRLRGVMSPEFFREEDMKNLGESWNANLVRWQIVESPNDGYNDKDINAYNTWLAKELNDVQKALDACQKYGLKMVIDMHKPIGGRSADGDLAMFHNKAYNDHFVATWAKIAMRFKGHPALWSYDLVNEPYYVSMPLPGMDSLSTQIRAAQAIRKIDPKTTILIESGEGGTPEGFAYMKKVDLPNIVYEAHMYGPTGYTHQGVYNDITNIAYPGNIGGIYYDKEALRKILKPVRDFQMAYNVHIYIGEFSAPRWAPGAAMYLADCISLFEEYNWDWSYHAYREWTGWSLEHDNLPFSRTEAVLSTTPSDRKKVVLDWFAKNKKPTIPSAGIIVK